MAFGRLLTEFNQTKQRRVDWGSEGVEVPHTRADKEAVGIGERGREREFGDVYTQTAFLREAEV